jgi:hypothetical protein
MNVTSLMPYRYGPPFPISWGISWPWVMNNPYVPKYKIGDVVNGYDPDTGWAQYKVLDYDPVKGQYLIQFTSGQGQPSWVSRQIVETQ